MIANRQLLIPFLSVYTRNTFLIQSKTREDVSHLIDIEGFDGEDIYCSCEAFVLGKQHPCQHIKQLIE